MWFPECPLFGGKNTLQKRFGTKDSVRCSEFRGGRFSEVASVLHVWDFQSVTRTLSALGSVSASRSVRCILAMYIPVSDVICQTEDCHTYTIHVHMAVQLVRNVIRILYYVHIATQLAYQ